MRKKSNPILFIAFILIAIALIIANTYARYNKQVAGDGSVYVAKWSFKANGFGISRTDYVTSSQIMEGKLAPGTSGTITVDIDVTDCEVAVDYLIILHSFEGKPTHLIIKDEAGEELEYDSVNNRYMVEGSIMLSEHEDLTNSNDEVIKHVQLPFEWPYETVPTVGVTQAELDETDTNEGKTIEEMSFYVTVMGMQQAQTNKAVWNVATTGLGQTQTTTVELDNKEEGVIEVVVDVTGATSAVDYTITLQNIRNGLTNMTFTERETNTVLTQSNGVYTFNGTITKAEIDAGNSVKRVLIDYVGTNTVQSGKLDTYKGARIQLAGNGINETRSISNITTLADANAPMLIDVIVLGQKKELTAQEFNITANVTDNNNGIIQVSGASINGVSSITYTGPESGSLTPTVNGTNYTATTGRLSNGTYTFTIIDNEDNEKTATATIDGETITATSTVNYSAKTIIVTVTNSRFDIASIVNRTTNTTVSTNSNTGTTGTLTAGTTYYFDITDIKGQIKTLETQIVDADYIISSEADLITFRTAVNGGKKNATAYQVADITLTSTWTPIDGTSSKPFTGIYDGGGHYISGMSTAEIDAQCFIKYLSGTVRNLTIKDCNILGTNYSAALVSTICGSSTIQNCHLNGTVQARGGLISQITGGNSVLIEGCSVSGNILTRSSDASNAGFVYSISGSSTNVTIRNCINYADITGNYVAGGFVYNCSSVITFENCCNKGTITQTGIDTRSGATNGAGGLIAYCTNNIIIKNCYNTGDIYGRANYGGIAGMVKGATISNCYNSGNVYLYKTDSSSANAGGIVGSFSTISGFTGTIDHVFNTGSVEGRQKVGGICGNFGYTTKSESLSYAYNTGNISCTYMYAGGLVGNCGYLNIQNVFNTGNVTSTGGGGYLGGIVSYGRTCVRYAYNAGNVQGSNQNYVGGISGSVSSGDSNWTNYYEYCYNVGIISGKSYVGGISGNLNSTYNSIRYCYNSGSIGISGTTTKVGGVVGSASSNYTPLTYCSNMGVVYGTGNYVGSLIGETYSSSVPGTSNCSYYLGGNAIYSSGASYKGNVGTAYALPTLSAISVVGTTYFKTMANRDIPALIWENESNNLSLINGESKFVADTNNINGGNPILAWQAD